jgi:putative ABC transport system permease protein
LQGSFELVLRELIKISRPARSADIFGLFVTVFGGHHAAVLIAAISSYIGVRKVLTIEPFDIFRG